MTSKDNHDDYLPMKYCGCNYTSLHEPKDCPIINQNHCQACNTPCGDVHSEFCICNTSGVAFSVPLTPSKENKPRRYKDGMHCKHGNSVNFDCGGCKLDASTPKTDEGKGCCEKCKREKDSDYWADEQPIFDCIDSACSCHEHKAVEGWDLEQLSEKVHHLYCAQYLKDHGKPYWTEGEYSKLDERTKEYDRNIARFISSLILKAKAEGANVERKFIENVLDGIERANEEMGLPHDTKAIRFALKSRIIENPEV